MDYIYIGKLVNTHGIKGEVKLLSNFEYKDRIFIKDFKLYIGEQKEEVTIISYRHHKIFDMLLFKEYNYINDVLKFKGKKVYINKSDLILNKDEYFLTDYIGLNCYYNDISLGKVTDIIDNNGYKLFYINGKYIPLNNNFIEKIDLNNKILILKNVGDLI